MLFAGATEETVFKILDVAWLTPDFSLLVADRTVERTIETADVSLPKADFSSLVAPPDFSLLVADPTVERTFETAEESLLTTADFSLLVAPFTAPPLRTDEMTRVMLAMLGRTFLTALSTPSCGPLRASLMPDFSSLAPRRRVAPCAPASADRTLLVLVVVAPSITVDN